MHQQIEILKQKIKYIWEDETLFDVSLDQWIFTDIKRRWKMGLRKLN